MVDHRGTHITEEDGEHHTLRITGIHHTYDDCHRTDQETVDKLAGGSAARGDGISSHKHGTEGEATEDEVMPPNHGLTSMLEKQSQNSTTHEHTQHGTPRGDTSPEQNHSTDGDGNE